MEPQAIWNEYNKISQYLSNNNVFEEVKENEDFYEGKHWKYLANHDSLPTPVINVLGRSCKFLVASLASNEVAVSMTPYSVLPEDKERMKVVSEEIEQVIEVAKIKETTRLAIRNACVDGAGFMMQSFDPYIETGQPAKGQVVNQIIDNTNMFYGNPYSGDTQSQPFIIVALRQDVNQVREEAKENGVPKDIYETIQPDNNGTLANDDSTNLVTVLIYYTKKGEEGKKTVWFTKCTKDVIIKEETDLGYTRYPISYMPWEKKKNSYLGVSPMTSVLENQKFINKTFAIAMMYALQSAFPKIVYDKNKMNIREFLDNVDPTALASMDMMGKFLDFIKIPDFSNNVIDLAKETIAQTKDTLGVTDVSLGNVKAENTSAIIALQEASAVPLEIQKQNFYEFWEDTIRNIIDIISVTYGTRFVMSDDLGLAEVDFSILKDMNYRLRVEIGAGAQYSEIAQINTLDKYLQAGLLPGSVHAKLIPSKYILGKDELVNAMKEREQAMMEPTPNIGQRMLSENEVL